MLVKLKKLKRKWKVKVVWPHGLYSPWNSPGQNTGVGSLCLLQGIFPTQGLNLCLLHCRWILYQLSHKGNPRNSKDSGSKKFEKCWFKFCQRAVLNAELPRTFNMQSKWMQLMLHRASLVAQLVKNPPAMQETLVQFLGWEDPLEKGKATHFSILAWRIPWTL